MSRRSEKAVKRGGTFADGWAAAMRAVDRTVRKARADQAAMLEATRETMEANRRAAQSEILTAQARQKNVIEDMERQGRLILKRHRRGNPSDPRRTADRYRAMATEAETAFAQYGSRKLADGAVARRWRVSRRTVERARRTRH
jgi:hypothetical protein